MDMLLNSILLNTDAQGGGFMQIVMIVLLIAVFYFFIFAFPNHNLPFRIIKGNFNCLFKKR